MIKVFIETAFNYGSTTYGSGGQDVPPEVAKHATRCGYGWLLQPAPEKPAAAPAKPAAKPQQQTPVTLELICQTMTVPEMKAALKAAGVKTTAKKETTLAALILKNNLYEG